MKGLENIREPPWLDAFFAEKLFRKSDQDESISVSDVNVQPATANGDNYTSDMYRLVVQFSRVVNGYEIRDVRSVIAKVEVADCSWKQVISESELFEREMSMMTETLPIMNERLTEVGRSSISARCLQVQYQFPMYLIIEDLAPRGFRLAERRRGLDLDHCLLAVRNVANFHAASLALAEKDPSAVKKYRRSIRYADASPLFVKFVNERARAVGEEAANWEDVNPRISEKLLKLSESTWRKGCEATVFLEDDFNVLNHGECMLANMMFRYNEQGRPVEQIFVDFQTCNYGSPAADILCLIGSSSSADVRTRDRELLVREYHDTLSITMAELRCSTKAPSFERLQQILERRAFCEVVTAITALPRALIGETKIDDGSVKANRKSSLPAQLTEDYRKIMTKALLFYDDMGLLDT